MKSKVQRKRFKIGTKQQTQSSKQIEVGSGAIVDLASHADRSHPSCALENLQTEKSVDNSMNNYSLTISIRPCGMVYLLTRSLY